jgi:hypothetical protein
MSRPGNIKSMQAIIGRERAVGIDGLALAQVPYPHAAENDVIVRVHAAGFTPDELEWPATWTDRAGRDRTPTIPGHDVAGVVDELGYGTTGLHVGQRVFGITDWCRNGTLAEFVAVEARNLAPLSAGVDPIIAAALPVSRHGRDCSSTDDFRRGRRSSSTAPPEASDRSLCNWPVKRGLGWSVPAALPSVRPCSIWVRICSWTCTMIGWRTLAKSTWYSTCSAVKSSIAQQHWFARAALSSVSRNHREFRREARGPFFSSSNPIVRRLPNWNSGFERVGCVHSSERSTPLKTLLLRSTRPGVVTANRSSV